ncbi:MAG TPA: hypothetical protein VGR35_01185 [Tepidisphaeraceae bacterium]|nr:hypothetical protein [Tepidisphaeraceae bacterium]
MTTQLAQIIWQAPRLLPLAIVIAVATVLLVLVFYIPQARRLRQPWRLGLPLLRLVVGLALGASVLQPAIVRSESDDERGAVVVLVDSSRSMSVVDPRSPSQRVVLADALGLLPEGARPIVAPELERELDALLKRIVQAAAARADVDYAKLSGQGVIAAQTRYDALSADLAALATQLTARQEAMPRDSELAKALAALAPTGDMSEADYRAHIAAAQRALRAAQAVADAAFYARADVKRICDGLATLSRAELANRAVNGAKGAVLQSLPASGVYGYSFAETLQPMPVIPAPTSRPAVNPTGLRSDIAGAVRAVGERMKGRLLQAIVVLSDGRQVGGESEVASALGSAGIPVYAVSVGTPAPKDVAISEFALPPRQFVGETMAARVQLRGAGMKGKSIEVKLEVAGQSPQAKTVTFAGPSATAEFPLKFDSAGIHAVSVGVTVQDGEVTGANNTVRRWVIATADRAKVSLVGASASWDFQHLRAALARASWAEIEAEVLDAPGARWSLQASDIAEQSVIILCDVRADHLTPRQWDALYRLVAHRGGSVIVIAGRNTASPQFIDSPLLTDLLPFRAGSRPAWRSWPGEQPLFRFQPAPGAAELAMLRLSEDPAATVERWLELPPLFQYLPVTELKANATPLLIERESGLAMLTESRLGLGRVLFFGANETWRWRRGDAGASEHERFWLQLVRHAGDDAYAVASGALRLDVNGVALEPGEPLRVRAKVMHSDQPPPDQVALPLTIMREGAQIAEAVLLRDAASAGQYGATIHDLSVGAYELRLRDPLDPSNVAKLPVHVQVDAESEMRDVSGNERMLRRLAESSGGELLMLSEWNTLPRRLREEQQTNRQVAEQRLWDSPQLFAFVLGCLGVEWAMRKRLGLA